MQTCPSSQSAHQLLLEYVYTFKWVSDQKHWYGRTNTHTKHNNSMQDTYYSDVFNKIFTTISIRIPVVVTERN